MCVCVFLDKDCYIFAMIKISGKFCSENSFNLDEMSSFLDVIQVVFADVDRILHCISRLFQV